MNLLKSIGTIGLALLVFFSSAGVILNKHFCQNELKSTSLFLLPESCHSKMEKAQCPGHAKTMTCAHDMDNGCCDNDSDYLKVEQDKQLQILNLEEQLPAQIIQVVSVVHNAVNAQLSTINRYKIFRPPIVRNNIPALLQTFLF